MSARSDRRRPGWALAAAALAVLAVLAAVWTGVTRVAPRAGLGDLAEAAAILPPPAGTVTGKLERGERVNLLLLAHGGAGGDDPDFTDAIVVVSLRPTTGAATLVSLPRYLLADVPAPRGMALQAPLYAAYALGARRDNPQLREEWRRPTGPGDLAAAAVADLIAQPIDGWAATDSDGFAALVDALGGVTVDVPEPLDDPRYPIGDSDRTIRIHFEAGPQRLDGTRAVEYSRSRMSTSELDRSRRQELVLAALLHQLRSPRLGLSSLREIAALESGLLTNLNLADIRALAGSARRLDVSAFRRLDLAASGLLEERTAPGGRVLLVPRTGDYEEVRRYVAATLP